MNRLKEITTNRDETNLRQHVAQYLLDHNDTREDLDSWLQDMAHGGCESGMGPLVYTFDAQAFYDRFYKDIEALRNDWEETTGEPLLAGEMDHKTYFAYFAWETTCWSIRYDLEAWDEYNAE